ncbi:MAG: protein translocase subunit SecF [Spirochaetaceae bacterium]|jgi:preprotein translocase subunit SecF|nr:protein translocase subunit SecF [Spirochaetaceae bacterium]
MKRAIRFSNFFIPAVILSASIIIAGIAGYFLKGGFNLGVDFQAGLMQEVQFAPEAFSITYSGKGNAVISYSRTALSVVITGTQAQNENISFEFSAYPTLGELLAAMQERIEGFEAELVAPAEARSEWLVESAQGTPRLGSTPYMFHYLEPGIGEIDIANVRQALSGLGAAAVQVLGAPSERRFMIRLEDEEDEGGKVLKALEDSFGDGAVAVTRSDYVGSRFSKQLQDQAGILMALTMLLILVYVSIRFKPQFAVGAVLAIAHDALIMVAFIAWTRMEFNTTTIAAVLTILGYSVNDTIVIFDRIRETRRLYSDLSFRGVLDRALTDTLARTIITTLTTMLAVFALYFFTTGSMKDFALALLVGMTSGVYSTLFIASGWTLFWEKFIKRKDSKKAEPAEGLQNANATLP